MCRSATILSIFALCLSNNDAHKLFGLANNDLTTALHRQKSTDTLKKLGRKRARQENNSSSQDHTCLSSIIQTIRAGGGANTENFQSAPKAKASKSSSTKQLTTKTSSTKRGTRTTGTGASKRNPSIFSDQNVATSKSWTAAALAGDMLNRQTNDASKTREHNNPMTGRLLAKLSNRGTLVLKIPPDQANEENLYVELSERDHNSTNTGQDESISTKQSVDIEYISVACLKKITNSSKPFIPLEGIYGIYHLPCSGPHAVIITESEETYTSLLSTSQTVTDIPLLELRRIKSLEIVPLRSRLQRENNKLLLSEEQAAEETRQLQLLRSSFKEHDFYFTVPRKSNRKQSPVVHDVTHSMQRAFLDWFADQTAQYRWWVSYDKTKATTTPHRMADSRFFWNEQPALVLLQSVSTSDQLAERLLDRVIPVSSAFVGVERSVPIPVSNNSPKSSNEAYSYDQILISRRSKYRTGTRFTRRGADDTGAVANYAETEQLCFVTTNSNATHSPGRLLSEVYSHVQTRGSIPLHWSSPADVKAYRPRVFIGVDPITQAKGLRDHLIGELWWYSSFFKPVENDNQQVKLAMVNLIDKHGDQGRLGTTFDSVLSAVLDVYESAPVEQAHNSDAHAQQLLNQKHVKHVWYDFHAECKGGRWDKLSNLLDEVSPILSDQAYFCAVPLHKGGPTTWRTVSIQDGVVRTNCMDCLDRTNVVQSMFGRYMLYRIIHERMGLSHHSSKTRTRKRALPMECIMSFKQCPLSLPWAEGESAHRHLWADNADAISRLYAGTPALKGDFTRTGVRTKRGAVDDGINSVQRYYLNNFIDADRQEGMDLLVGSAEFNYHPSDHDDVSRVILLQELARDKRRGYDKSHVRIKKKTGEWQEEHESPKLNWLPGDLRHHMKAEALQSRSPLSSAANEEELHNATKSSDFLMKVACSSLAPYRSNASSVGIEVLRSIDNRVTSDKPWWAGESNDQRLDNSEALFASPQKAGLALIVLLVRAPIFTTAVLAALIGIL